jgi:hypothetical protein
MSERRAPFVVARALVVLLASTSLVLPACADNYRIGDQVLVDYEGNRCPGYVIDQKSRTRFRIHFDFEGYEWQEDVSFDKVLGRVKSQPPPCPLPRKVRLALGLQSTPTEQQQASPYRVGDRIRVRWRQSVYPATVLQIAGADRLLVHYEGHEKVWDETISADRIVDRHQ